MMPTRFLLESLQAGSELLVAIPQHVLFLFHVSQLFVPFCQQTLQSADLDDEALS